MVTLFVGCASSGNSGNSGDDSYMTLVDHLRRINGVQVRGTGDGQYVVINSKSSISSINRGKRTADKGSTNLEFDGSKQPLFILDGQKVGRDLNQVKSMVSPGRIASVKLLKGAAAAQYASQAGMGVISIKTKKEETDKENVMDN
jgi:outer membrane receptor protein involved in Fe transport